MDFRHKGDCSRGAQLCLLCTQWSSARRDRDPFLGLSISSLALSILSYWSPKPCSYCSSTEHYKLIFTNLPPFASKSHSSPSWKVTSSPPTSGCPSPSAATWEPAATQDARAVVSSTTKITSGLSTYFRTVPSCRATQPNYSRLLLYWLRDTACVCPAYCTFPCKGLPHSLLCSEVSSGLLPHTCWQKGPHNTHSWNPRLSWELSSRTQWLWTKGGAPRAELRCWSWGAGTWFSAEALLLCRILF